MSHSKISHIILSGGGITEIRKEFPWFPLKPTVDFFVSLGYKESTAKRYVSCLNKQEMSKRENLLHNNFYLSKYADVNNLLVDTSVLQHAECLNIIENSEAITFLYSTIIEMDKKKSCPKSSSSAKQSLAQNIRYITRKIIEVPEKYHVYTFQGNVKANDYYPDDVLIQYLLCLPKQDRPTIFSADGNLTIKAKAFDLEYIHFSWDTNASSKPKPQKDLESSNVISLQYGVKIIKNASKFYLEYKGTFSLDIIRGTSTIPYKKGELKQVYNRDKICIYEKCHETVSKHELSLDSIIC